MTADDATREPAERESVTRERVITVARGLVEEGGVEALSMRKLAAELGVAPTAIYWHVGGRDELISAIVDELLTEMHDIQPIGTTARERLASVATQVRRQVETNQALIALAIESGRFPGMWFPAQVALAREVSAAGLRGAEAARAVIAILYVAGAFIVLEHELAEHMEDARATVALWNAIDDPEIDRELLVEMQRGMRPDDVYALALDAVLDSIEARIAAGRERPSSD